jgi:hypothetical protein
MTSTARYFIMRLPKAEADQLGGSLEIQLLKLNGEAKAVAFANDDSDMLTIGAETVQRAVIESAAKLRIGTGIYVDSNGKEISPF